MGQHYVARLYLKTWATKGKLYCLKGGRVSERGLRGVANEKLFYEVHDLTPDEHRLVEQLGIDNCPEPLKSLQRRFVQLFCLAPRLKKKAEHIRTDPAFKSRVDHLIANTAEIYHHQVEESLARFLKSMLAGNIAFYADDKQAAEFLGAICVQFTRTKRATETTLSQIGTTYKGCDVRRVLNVLSHLYATMIGQQLYAERKNFKLLLLDNSTDTPFITADQPIINLHATFDVEKPPEKLEFYYPLSPRKAMLLVENSNRAHAGSISALAVNAYNVLMVKNS
jgi:hypothetical protein